MTESELPRKTLQLIQFLIKGVVVESTAPTSGEPPVTLFDVQYLFDISRKTSEYLIPFIIVKCLIRRHMQILSPQGSYSKKILCLFLSFNLHFIFITLCVCVSVNRRNLERKSHYSIVWTSLSLLQRKTHTNRDMKYEIQVRLEPKVSVLIEHVVIASI